MSKPADFDWDSVKADGNVDDHGLSFRFARRVFLNPTHVVVDTTRPRDGETRSKAIGVIDGKL